MEPLLAIVVGVLFASGIYLMLRRNLLRFIFGLILLSNGANLLIFTAGRVTRANPPLIPADSDFPVGEVANALPQALVLTAIVIGFGLVSFALVLLMRAYQTLGTVDTDVLAQTPEDIEETKSSLYTLEELKQERERVQQAMLEPELEVVS